MLRTVTTAEANYCFCDQIKWENSLRPEFCKKGRDLPGVGYPVFFTKEWFGVTKDEGLKALKGLGAKVAYSTWDRYVLDGLVEKPTKTENRGRGKGKTVYYYKRSLFEAYAAWQLLNGSIRMRKEFLQKLLAGLINFQEIGPWVGRAWHPWLFNIFVAYFFYSMRREVPDENNISFIYADNDLQATIASLNKIGGDFEFYLAMDQKVDYEFILLKRLNSVLTPIMTAKIHDVFNETAE